MDSPHNVDAWFAVMRRANLPGWVNRANHPGFFGWGRLKFKGYYHVINNFVVEPTVGGAKGHQYVQVVTIGGNGKAPMVDHGGRYEDEYLKTPEGWRIKTRRYVQMFPPQ